MSDLQNNLQEHAQPGTVMHVLGVGVFAPEPGASVGPATPQTTLLGARALGRASALTRMFSAVIEQAVTRAEVSVAQVPILYASAYGEIGTTLALLDMMFTGDGKPSPARFQASVHNTASGQISIAQGNRHFTTALAAGHDTVAMALVEASAWLATHGGVVVVACAEESSPRVLFDGPGYPACAAAFVLSREAPTRPAALATLSAPTPNETEAAEIAVGSPCAGAVMLALAVLGRTPANVILNAGSALPWRTTVTLL